MFSATIHFDQVDPGNGDDGRLVNHMPVDVAADGETVVFRLPDGNTWNCDQDELGGTLLGQLVVDSVN